MAGVTSLRCHFCICFSWKTRLEEAYPVVSCCYLLLPFSMRLNCVMARLYTSASEPTKPLKFVVVIGFLSCITPGAPV